MPTDLSGGLGVIAIGSGIGSQLAERWLKRGQPVVGTFLTYSDEVKRIEELGAEVLQCDMGDVAAVDRAAGELRSRLPNWEAVVVCPGVLEPIGEFAENDMDAWEESVMVNFVRQVRMVHGLVKERDSEAGSEPAVVFIAGGGVNSAPVNYSAYTISKVALVKMTELLDAEVPGVSFSIVGPGWVDTKIHNETLMAGKRAGENWQKTKDMLASDDMTSMKDVIDCLDWVIKMPKEVVGGRNISVAHDEWREEQLQEKLLADGNMYKLRRFGN